MKKSEQFTADDERRLDGLFQDYKSACPDMEPSQNFMPALWQKIEARHSFWFTFVRLGRGAVTASAAVCLLLLVLNLVSTPQTAPSYTDALLQDSSAEMTYYTEAIRTSPAFDTAPSPYTH